MDTQTELKELEKKLIALREEKQKILDDIKSDHPAFFDWMVRSGMDLNNLRKHSAEIAAAITIVVSPTQFKFQYIPSPPDTSKLTPVVKMIDKNELAGKSEDEKLKIVKERYGPIINRTAKKYDLDPKLILTTIMLESGGDARAIRQEPSINDASYGLGQILYGTARGLGFQGKPEQLFDPETNIDLIGKYHRRNMDVYGKDLTAQQLTIAYNSGSPYNQPYPGHITKFNKWFDKVGNLLI